MARLDKRNLTHWVKYLSLYYLRKKAKAKRVNGRKKGGRNGGKEVEKREEYVSDVTPFHL